MITENVSTLQIHKLTKEQYEIALENGQLNDNSIYLTPTEIKDYALKSDLENKADLIDGKVPFEQLPDNIGSGGGGAQVQADFAQNDDTQPDYIKNRIAYTNGVKNVEFFNQILTCEYDTDSDMYIGYVTGLTDEFINIYNNLGDIVVTYDGTEYNLGKRFYEGVSFYGNPIIAELEATEDPFMFYVENSDGENVMYFFPLTDPAPEDPDNAPTIDHTIEISYQEEDVYTDSKYFNIDRALTVGKGSILHDKTNYIFDVDGDIGVGYIGAEEKFFLPPKGKKVKVYWDNSEYICTVTQMGDDENTLAIGSVDAFENEDFSLVNEPFVIISAPKEPYYEIYSMDANPTHEMYIVAEDECKKKIGSEHLNINLNYDDYPEANSENLITSGAIYRALGYRSDISVENSVNDWSNNPVSSQAVYNELVINYYTKSEVDTAIANKQINIDSSVINGSNNAVSGGAVYDALGNYYTKSEVNTAIANKQINVDSSVMSGSNNAVSGGAVYNALGNYYTKSEVTNNISASLNSRLSNYYTKSETDNLFGDVSSILDEINALIGE